MQARSALWKTLAASGSARMEAKAVINGTEYPEILSPVINRAMSPDALSVGNCVSASAQLSIRPVSGIVIPDKTAVTVKVRFTDGNRASEWMTVGTFYANRRTTDAVTGTVAFQGFDIMRKADAPFPNLSGFPKAMNSAVMEISRNIGVEVDARTWENVPTGSAYYVPLPADGEKMIKILGYIGGVCGGNWIITPQNKLRLVPLVSASGAGTAEDPASIVGITGRISTGNAVTVTGVSASSGSKTYFAGNETGAVVHVSANPYVTQATVSALLSKYTGLSYVPYSIEKGLYDPALEIGDFLISRSDIQSIVCQETAYYSPAFRGNLSAPFVSESDGEGQSISEAIAQSGDTAGDLSVRIYKFTNQSAVTIGDGRSAEIINFDFAAGAGQDVVFHAEVKHTTETTETGSASTGWTCTDAVLTVTYYINGAEVTAYHPTKSEMDGANLLHLTYHFTNGQYNAGNFRATLSLSGGSVAIATGDARAYIIGQGYSGGDTNWVTEDGLVFIGVESYPEKMNYTTGETLDLTGLVVKAYYADGTETDITTDCAVTPADGAELEPGENVVEVSYTADGAEFADSFSVYCEANGVLFIEVTPPTTTEYFPGETLDLTGAVVTATYEDGSQTDVTSECVFTPANGTTLTGDETITVNAAYTENDETFAAYFDVNVKSVRIMSYPLKSDYFVGETLDYTGLEVVEALSDGTTRDVTSDCVLSPADGTTVSSAGDIMVDVRYNGKSLGTFWVAVASVAVTTPPDKVDYTQGDTLDYTGLVITETLPDGTTRDITPECTFTPSEGSTLDEPGTVTVTVERDGVTVVTFDVEVSGEGVIVTVVGEALSEVIASGDWWTLFSNGLLSIYCEGDMPNYSNYVDTPWFSYKAQITSVTISNSVTSIGDRVFCNCGALASVAIPDSVTNIGASAFASCSALTSVAIPDSVTNIGDFAFYNCRSLTSVNVGSGNTAYTSENGILFNKDKSILVCYPPRKAETTYVIPDGVTSIAPYAFFSCSSLTSVTIPESMTTIGDNAFNSCYSLTSVTIPNSVTFIGQRAFEYSGLASVTIPESMTSIGPYAFSSCEKLASVTIPDSVIEIGSHAFCWCYELKSIIIPDSVITIAPYAFGGAGFQNVTIPGTVSSIGKSAFDSCPNLTSATLSEGTTRIEEAAFYQCKSLKSITIPESVTYVGMRAFTYCNNLTDVYYAGTEAQRRAITIRTHWSQEQSASKFTNATWHYNSTGPT